MNDDLVLKIYAPYSNEEVNLITSIYNRNHINIFGSNYLIVKMEEVQKSESIDIPFVLQANHEKAHHIIYARKINIVEKSKPKLIQGYTAEQWQEIIDGGYLCEFRNGDGKWKQAKMELKELKRGVSVPFVSLKGNNYSDCRPAQIKGVMRPIFVEPVDKLSFNLVFFDRYRRPVSIGLCRWDTSNYNKTALNYIEV